jgi:putative MATE family efflux protein
VQKTEQNRQRLLEGPVGPTLFRLALPMVFGILSMVAYNLADTFFVGRLGRNHLAALSFTFPVVLTIGSIAQGIGMGTSAAVARAIGAGDYHRVRRLTADSLILGLLIVGVFASAGLATIDPLFRLLGARGIIIDYIRRYMSVWYIGMIFVVVPMVGNNIIRATGDSRTPGTVMMIGALANVILDPILIFGLGPVPALGIRGAAIATLMGRGFTFCVAMYVLTVREKLLVFSRDPGAPPPGVGGLVRRTGRSWVEILHVGVPNAAARMIIPLGQGFVTRMVAAYGAAAVAGYGVATRIEFFSLAAMNALSSVFPAFVGQNLGADKPDRVIAGFRESRRFSLWIGGTVFGLYLILAPHIATLFNDDPEVVRTAALYMRIVSAAYAAQGLYLVISAGLNVLKRPLTAAGLGLLEMFGLMVPLVFVGSLLFGLPGIVTAVALSYLATGVAAWFVVMNVLDTKQPVSRR